jgi:hypothetical protein
MTELPYLPPGVRGFNDRRTTLLVMGILLIFLGVICGCMTLALPVALIAPPPPGTPRPRIQDLIGGLFIYLFIAIAFISLGIGSIKARRWVRPIVLVFSWIWLVIGVITFIAMCFTMKDFGRQLAASPGMPANSTGFQVGFYIGMLGFMFAVYILLPSVLILCYYPASVQATLEFYDATPRWTDACPIPVLGLCAILGLGALWMLVALAQGIYLLFGFVVIGIAARVALVITAALFALAAWCTYRLRPAGWTLAVVMISVLAISGAITLLRVPLMEIYRLAGTPPAQLELLSRMRMLRSGWMALWVAASAGITIGYAFWVKRYFTPPNDQTTATAYAQ